VDPHDAVVKLCADGMAAEAEGRVAEAKSLFAEAWRIRSNDFEACIAAHYVARHQTTAEETLRWNLDALRYADSAANDRVQEFYPSLYLNVAHAFEQLGNAAAACRHYSMAAERLHDLPPGGYASMIEGAVNRGRSRTCVS
jgi:hypothetical protein